MKGGVPMDAALWSAITSNESLFNALMYVFSGTK